MSLGWILLLHGIAIVLICVGFLMHVIWHYRKGDR